MNQLNFFIKPVKKKIIENVKYGELKVESFMPSVVPDKYILYPTGGYHYFSNVAYAFKKYKEPIWPYLTVQSGNRIKYLSIIPNVQFGGYPTASLELVKTGHNQPHVMHKIVAEAYLPNEDPTNNIHVCHVNDEKCNYLPENLKWETPSDNHKGRRHNKASTNEEFYDFYKAQEWVKE